MKAKLIRALFLLGYWAKNYHGVFLGAAITLSLPTIAVIVRDIVYLRVNLFLNPTFWIALVLLIGTSLSWLVSTELILEWITRLRLKDKFRVPKPAILSINELTDAELRNKNLLRWTEFTPSDWVSYLQKEKLNLKKVPIDEISNNWSMIINPFGELYPEKNIPNMETLKEIKEYIRKGGVFVNTAGLAFSYMWSPDTGAEELTGKRLETYEVIKQQERILLFPVVAPLSFNLVDTCLFHNFGVRTTLFPAEKEELLITEAPGFKGLLDNLDKGAKRLLEFRSALRCENPDYRLIPILKASYKNEDGRTHECYPAAAVRYGGGYLILFGIVLKTQETLSIVIRTVKYLISKLQKEGMLEST